ncbi:guanylate kinase-related [Holotrichia oblita]|nr:guanylate kinase-related [Holotrichia oblita]
MEIQKGNLIIISGPSGVGKGTVRARLFKKHDLNLIYSISCTTRKPRATELDGIDYYFIAEEQFEKMIAEDKFLEWTKFVNNYYGTPTQFVDESIAAGKNVILEIEIDGAQKVLAKRPDAVTVFIIPPSLADLERRIRQRRSESEEIIKMRMDKAREEIKFCKDYQHVVVNDSVIKASNKIAKIIKKHQGEIKC